MLAIIYGIKRPLPAIILLVVTSLVAWEDAN
jgi:hypothetical protein